MAAVSLFQGKLVRLTAPRSEDANEMARWYEDSQYLRNLDTDYARTFTPQEITERHLQHPSGTNSQLFHLRTLADDRLIGFVALFNIEWNNGSATMAIGIGEPEYRGKGYGADALERILNYAFNELNLYRVGLDVIADNQPAIHSYQRAGFQEEGCMRSAVHRDGQRTDRLIMGILRPEWQALQEQRAQA